VQVYVIIYIDGMIGNLSGFGLSYVLFPDVSYVGVFLDSDKKMLCPARLIGGLFERDI